MEQLSKQNWLDVIMLYKRESIKFPDVKSRSKSMTYADSRNIYFPNQLTEKPSKSSHVL